MKNIHISVSVRREKLHPEQFFGRENYVKIEQLRRGVAYAVRAEIVDDALVNAPYARCVYHPQSLHLHAYSFIVQMIIHIICNP